MKACLQCFTDAGLDTTFRYAPSMDFVWEIWNFCHSGEPSLFFLLEQLFTWMKTFDAPTNVAALPVRMIAVVDSLCPRFTFTSGMNSPRDGAVTYISALSQSIDGPAPLWWQTSLTAGTPIPTEYLAQSKQLAVYGVWSCEEGEDDELAFCESEFHDGDGGINL
jgi:hypothetical protein